MYGRALLLYCVARVLAVWSEATGGAAGTKGTADTVGAEAAGALSSTKDSS